MTTTALRLHRTFVAALLGGALAACAADRAATGAAVPDGLAPSPQASLATVATARGVQIYECRPAADTPGAYGWRLVAPEADLFDARGALIGRHLAGPAWEARDGSRIVGTVQARSDAPRADAIAWLLLGTKPAGPDGAFSKVTQVQRINTSGGTAPASGCTQSTAGTTVRIPYSAEYYFWRAGAVYSSY